MNEKQIDAKFTNGEKAIQRICSDYGFTFKVKNGEVIIEMSVVEDGEVITIERPAVYIPF